MAKKKLVDVKIGKKKLINGEKIEYNSKYNQTFNVFNPPNTAILDSLIRYTLFRYRPVYMFNAYRMTLISYESNPPANLDTQTFACVQQIPPCRFYLEDTTSISIAKTCIVLTGHPINLAPHLIFGPQPSSKCLASECDGNSGYP